MTTKLRVSSILQIWETSEEQLETTTRSAVVVIREASDLNETQDWITCCRGILIRKTTRRQCEHETWAWNEEQRRWWLNTIRKYTLREGAEHVSWLYLISPHIVLMLLLILDCNVLNWTCVYFLVNLSFIVSGTPCHTFVAGLFHCMIVMYNSLFVFHVFPSAIQVRVCYLCVVCMFIVSDIVLCCFCLFYTVSLYMVVSFFSTHVYEHLLCFVIFMYMYVLLLWSIHGCFLYCWIVFYFIS